VNDARQTDWAAIRRRLASSQAGLADLVEIRGQRLQDILQQRAAELAKRAAAKRRPADAVSVLVVTVGAERYGLPLDGLVAVQPRCVPVAVPGGPGHLLGAVNARGEIWAVSHLGALLGLSAAKHEDGYVVLLRHERRRIGLRVDAVDGTRRIDRSALLRPPGNSQESATGLVSGIDPADGLAVVDLAALWSGSLIMEGG